MTGTRDATRTANGTERGADSAPADEQSGEEPAQRGERSAQGDGQSAQRGARPDQSGEQSAQRSARPGRSGEDPEQSSEEVADIGRGTGDDTRARDGSPTRVLFYRTSYGSFAGGTQMLLRLLRSLDPAAFEARVLTQRRDELCRRAADVDGVSVAVVPYRGRLDQYGGALLSQPLHGRALTALRVLQFDVEAAPHLRWADVVWCDCLRSLLTIGPFALASPTPVVWNVGLGPGEDRQFLTGLGLRLADRVFIESRRQARQVFDADELERFGDRLTVFHKGVDVERFASADPSDAADATVDSADAADDPADVADAADDSADAAADSTDVADTADVSAGAAAATDSYRVGVAARITPRKGLEDLVDAVAGLHERHDVQLLIAGEAVDEADRAYRRELERRVEHHGVDDKVTFLGWVDDVASFYATLDAFVLPSRDEGIPGAVREALAAGLPVVATDVGGTRDVVRDGETGLLVDPGDPAAVEAALEHLIEHPEAARRFADAGQRLVAEEFSLEAYARRYQRFLAEVART